jgi:hypothetical protein
MPPIPTIRKKKNIVKWRIRRMQGRNSPKLSIFCPHDDITFIRTAVISISDNDCTHFISNGHIISPNILVSGAKELNPKILNSICRTLPTFGVIDE